MPLKITAPPILCDTADWAHDMLQDRGHKREQGLPGRLMPSVCIEQGSETRALQVRGYTKQGHYIFTCTAES